MASTAGLICNLMGYFNNDSFYEWLSQYEYGTKIPGIAQTKHICIGTWIYLDKMGRWNITDELTFAKATQKELDESIMFIKEYNDKYKEPKMETFKENAYYPVGTKLIYEDEIIYKTTDIVCSTCYFNKSGKCPRIECWDGNYKVIGDAPTKHDKPGVTGTEYLKYSNDECCILTMANRNNVFITVEPVAKKDINKRMSEAIQKWHTMRTIKALPRAILLDRHAWAEWITHCATLGVTSYDPTLYSYAHHCKMYCSPDVKDVEIV